ncbi:MAG: RES family NAD+ phosphorylase [Hyphomonadaceae bacterium]|nr:RES family NAD+ phosphorylase [Hyphomonadaceae bacterium]
MSHKVWRIATDTPTFEANDLTGAGAKKTGGRWNQVDTAVVYTSETRAMACLETIVHLNAGGLPFNRYLVEVDIPDAIWAAAQREIPTSLPVGWDAQPAGRASVQFGTDWLKGKSSSLLLVPSAIVPEEWNVLINPDHSDSGQISAAKLRKWIYDPRLTRLP